MADEEPVLIKTADRVRTITLHRPESRNAINQALNAALAAAVQGADSDDDVDVVVLTGADPAFCAGLDLKELSSTGLQASNWERDANWYFALTSITKPVIGAINGPAITGGLEMVLTCDFLVASERAFFADTHGRVGALPGGGLTARLPDAVGLRKAKEMTFTGDFVDAATALEIGLVNHVVPHDELLAFATDLAQRIATNDQQLVRAMKANYDRGWASTPGAALTQEQEDFRDWKIAPEQIASRRAGIMDRGRSQTR